MTGDSTIADFDDGRIGLGAGVRSADGTICLSCFRLIGTPSRAGRCQRERRTALPLEVRGRVRWAAAMTRRPLVGEPTQAHSLMLDAVELAEESGDGPEESKLASRRGPPPLTRCCAAS